MKNKHILKNSAQALSWCFSAITARSIFLWVLQDHFPGSVQKKPRPVISKAL